MNEKKERRSLGVILVEGIMRLNGMLPLWWHRGWAKILAWFFGKVMHYREDVVMVNLSRCFPGKKYKEISRIKDRFYRHLGSVITESVWYGACVGKRGRRRIRRSGIVRITNPEVFNSLCDNHLQVMVLQSHTGNWEIISAIREYSPDLELSLDIRDVCVTYKEMTSKLWNRVMEDNRCAPIRDIADFSGYTESREVLRYAVSHRKDRRCYVFITDQYPYSFATKHNVGKFMNQDTVSMNAAATLACKMDMAVCYLRYAEREGGGYEMTFVPIAEQASQSDPDTIMKQYYSLLEEDLNAQPWNYLWSHKRWK